MKTIILSIATVPAVLDDVRPIRLDYGSAEQTGSYHWRLLDFVRRNFTENQHQMKSDNDLDFGVW